MFNKRLKRQIAIVLAAGMIFSNMSVTFADDFHEIDEQLTDEHAVMKPRRYSYISQH